MTALPMAGETTLITKPERRPFSTRVWMAGSLAVFSTVWAFGEYAAAVLQHPGHVDLAAVDRGNQALVFGWGLSSLVIGERGLDELQQRIDYLETVRHDAAPKGPEVVDAAVVLEQPFHTLHPGAPSDTMNEV